MLKGRTTHFCHVGSGTRSSNLSRYLTNAPTRQSTYRPFIEDSKDHYLILGSSDSFLKCVIYTCSLYVQNPLTCIIKSSDINHSNLLPISDTEGTNFVAFYCWGAERQQVRRTLHHLNKTHHWILPTEDKPPPWTVQPCVSVSLTM